MSLIYKNNLIVKNQFCIDKGMGNNLEKTEIIVFRNGSPLRNNEKCFLRKIQIRISSHYKYLNLIFTPMLSWFSAQQKLAAQTRKTTFSIYKYQRAFGYLPCRDIFNLFDSMIKPILCYRVQLWGHTYSEVIESVRFDFC